MVILLKNKLFWFGLNMTNGVANEEYFFEFEIDK